MTTAATAAPQQTGAELRAERAQLAHDRHIAAAVDVAVRMGAGMIGRPGTPLEGFEVYAGKLVRGTLPALSLEEIDARLAAIEEALPEADERDRAAAAEAEEAALREREQRIKRIAKLATDAAEAREATQDALQAARAMLSDAIAASPLGDVLTAFLADRLSTKAAARAMRMLIEAGQTPEQAEAAITARDINDETDLYALTAEVTGGTRTDTVEAVIQRQRERAQARPNPLRAS